MPPKSIVAVAERGGALTPSYVTTAVCAGCHQTSYDAWAGSHHDWAMRPATPQSVLGDFNNAKFDHFGIMSRFYQLDGRYFVETEGPDGRLAEFEIMYTVGVTPLQQYLIELEGGRLQALSLAWDVQDKRWFYLYPGERIAASDPLHWTGRLQNWNSQCAECHSTDYTKNYDPVTQSYSSTWTDMNVSCEACHGPGEAHAAWANGPDIYDPNRFSGAGPRGLTVDFDASAPGLELEVCAACHSRRQSLVSRSRAAGRPFLDDFVPALLRAGLYHADGQILDEVYVYGSFLQSKMRAAGVRCTDCHEPHRLGTLAEGNALCTRCHNLDGTPRFPNLKPGLFDSPSHHFHKEGGEGAKCANCHMPVKTYMVVDPRRDHSFRIPRPDLSVALGTPNACTGCHASRSDRWAADTVAAWYGPARRQEPHFGSALHAARANLPNAEGLLASLITEQGQPSIARATALSLLPRYAGPGSVSAYQAGLRDPDPLVRTAAVRALRPFPPNQRLAVAGHLLSDPVRAVRIEVVRALAAVPPHLMSSQQRAAFARAAQELVEAELATAERPESHLNLAAFYSDLGRLTEAETAYQQALRLDRLFVPTYINLADLYRVQDRDSDAEAVLHEAIARVPESAAAHYALGLALIRQGRRQTAADALRKAVEIEPDSARYGYVYAVALNATGRPDYAIEVLEGVLENHPTDRDVLIALITINRDRGVPTRALQYAEKLIAAYPRDQMAHRLIMELQTQR